MEHTIYVILAAVGGTALVVQVVLQIFGVVTDTDVDHSQADVSHADSHGAESGHGNWFLGVLSLKALSAFAGIFGLTGLALESSDMSAALRISIAVEAGLVAMVIVAFLMRSLSKLTASGTIDVRNAVGRTGSVYLRIPGARKAPGKVTLEIQGRTMQFDAVTDENEIPTGSTVEVVAVTGGETLQVRRPLA
jgi:hypothetical protein